MIFQPHLPELLFITLDVAVWAAFHAGTGYAAHRLGEHRLRRDCWLLRPRRFERGDRWYRHRLRIHRWKDLLPEAGEVFPGGISKRRLPSLDSAGLRLFIRETRRAELAHWWAMACGPLFALWNPPLATAVLVGYSVVVNVPFILTQRYNRFRTQAVLDRRAR